MIGCGNMKFTFDYKETLERRVTIEAGAIEEAIAILKNRIDTEEIVLGSEDFAGGEISMPLESNFLPQLQCCGDNVKNPQDFSIVLDYW